MVLRKSVLVAVFAGLTNVQTAAHHSFLAEYSTDLVTLQGTLSEFVLTNPHATLVVDVLQPVGGPRRWSMEWVTPRELMREGVTRTTLAKGDQLTVVGAPAKSQDRRLQIREIKRPSDGWEWKRTPSAAGVVRTRSSTTHSTCFVLMGRTCSPSSSPTAELCCRRS
jgi:hypothetical protein